MPEITSWLSLSEASKQLGVHFTTLRRWADQGLIEHIRTPGGKRMFSPKSIHDFLEQHRTVVQNPDAIETLKNKTLLQARHDIQNQCFSHKDWFLQLDEEKRLSMRQTGNKLIALMFQYCSRETGNEIFLQEGGRIAKEYGRFGFETGMTLEECIRTFNFFCRSMLNSTHESASLQGAADMNSQRLFQRLNYFLDEIMVHMVIEYNNYSQSAL